MSAPFYELTGRLAEFDALQARLRESPRLLVISAAPRSGTSRLLAQFDEAAASILVLVDARPCRDTLDLAMQIGDAAIAHFEPAAVAWWQSIGPPADLQALRVARTLAEDGIDPDGLRFGSGLPADRLAKAFRLTHTLLGAGPGAIVIGRRAGNLQRIRRRDPAAPRTSPGALPRQQDQPRRPQRRPLRRHRLGARRPRPRDPSPVLVPSRTVRPGATAARRGC